MAVEINYFQLNKAEYYVPVFVKVPGREIVLARRGGADHTHIDLVGEIKDDYGGTTVSNIRDHFDTKLSDATATEWAKRPIVFSSGYTLLPGKYTIKVLARDDETGRIGTFQTSFVIPNLNKETKRVAISSVVLSGQRQPYANAIYNVANGKEQAKQTAVGTHWCRTGSNWCRALRACSAERAACMCSCRPTRVQPPCHRLGRRPLRLRTSR